ncbi:hypothetical protein RC083_03115 [Pseudoalteromonas haloplanktis]|uniref:Orphan protein n=1 Tax=Pseudoalteromonas haloplanktis TaxID=228 RepID=A0ABU1B8E4_PSEHA|nr:MULTISPECIES: hypothetical protein [Pseudoalteromonas]MDQ9090581.1 hypothetical protein [Pseudoalteromonas haloplanktis]BDF94157.1 hypothetical protein KAN5_09950 [Pseudoalteromonas sp. KAN5]
MLTFNNQYRTEPYRAPDQTQTVIPPKAATELPDLANTSQVDTTTSLKNPRYEKNFLEQAKEALIYQRLGVDKEKIAELKAAIEELAKKIQDHDGDTTALSEQMANMQKMLEQEYQKGRELQPKAPEHDKGKIISALV